MPPFSFERAFSMRIPLVSVFLPDVTQQTHSFRASGVMSCHAASAALEEASAFRKSTGNLCNASFFLIIAVYPKAMKSEIQSVAKIQESDKIVLFPGSSAVERRPVKATVAGSIPARGAKIMSVKTGFFYFLNRKNGIMENM